MKENRASANGPINRMYLYLEYIRIAFEYIEKYIRIYIQLQVEIQYMQSDISISGKRMGYFMLYWEYWPFI